MVCFLGETIGHGLCREDPPIAKHEQCMAAKKGKCGREVEGGKWKEGSGRREVEGGK